MTLADKLTSQQIEDIKREWKERRIMNDGKVIHVSSINPLPYGYIVSFDYEDNFPYRSCILQLGGKVEVLPDCEFSCRFQRFIENYLNERSKT